MWAAAGVAAIGLTYRTAYIVDCRLSGGGLATCWTAGPLVVSVDELIKVAGALGVGGWLGFNTYNPSLRDPRRPDEPS